MSSIWLQARTFQNQVVPKCGATRIFLGQTHLISAHSQLRGAAKRLISSRSGNSPRALQVEGKRKINYGKLYSLPFSTMMNRPGMFSKNTNFHRFLFSSAATGKGKNNTNNSDVRKKLWRVGAKIVRYIRIPALILSVYGFGYRQGIIDYSRDPSLMEDEMLTSVLAGVDCHDRSKIRVARDGDWKTKLVVLNAEDELLRRVAVVGEKIIKVAKKFIDEELKKTIKERVENLPTREAVDEEVALQAIYRDEDVEQWALAQRRLAGKWSFILIDSPVPNAFVSEILPQRVFITTSMIHNFIENDDEMGLVLGHELSHLILGHTSERSSFETSMMTFEVLLLSIDPTEGILSLGFMSLLATIRKLLVASQSRDNERAADELGIKLAAMACFDTRRASQVFFKMHKFDTESGAAIVSQKAGKSLLSFVDTHPPSDERYESLLRASEVENMKTYEDTTCASIRKMFLDLLNASPPKGDSVKTEP